MELCILKVLLPIGLHHPLGDILDSVLLLVALPNLLDFPVVHILLPDHLDHLVLHVQHDLLNCVA